MERGPCQSCENEAPAERGMSGEAEGRSGGRHREVRC